MSSTAWSAGSPPREPRASPCGPPTHRPAVAPDGHMRAPLGSYSSAGWAREGKRPRSRLGHPSHFLDWFWAPPALFPTRCRIESTEWHTERFMLRDLVFLQPHGGAPMHVVLQPVVAGVVGMTRIVAAFLLLGLSCAARSQTSGNDLQQACQRPNQSYCLGYIEGATDAQSAWKFIMDTRRRPELEPSAPRFCIPDQVTLSQIQQVVMKVSPRQSCVSTLARRGSDKSGPERYLPL